MIIALKNNCIRRFSTNNKKFKNYKISLKNKEKKSFLFNRKSKKF